jgi:hypothetical protein
LNVSYLTQARNTSKVLNSTGFIGSTIIEIHQNFIFLTYLVYTKQATTYDHQ